MSEILTVRDLCLWYGTHQALKDINMMTACAKSLEEAVKH